MNDYNGGMMYLRNPARKYKHMRNMVRHLFEMRVINSFDIDVRFGYSNDAITEYLLNLAPSDINDAHNRAMADYSQKQRGRPPLARNKNKVMNTQTQNAQATDNNVLDEIFPSTSDNNNDSDNTEPEHNKTSAPAPSMLNAAKFVLKTEFHDYKREIGYEFERVDTKITSFDVRMKNAIKTINSDVSELREELRNMRPTIVVVQPIDLPAIELGVQHKVFPQLLALCNAAILGQQEPLNVWLYGPSGTGKTTAAKEAAKALKTIHNREFPFYALSKLSTEYQVLGFQNAAGDYVPTLFRKCYEHGGVIILDEIDSWSPNAMTALNGALANGYCAFPDGMVERHSDCIVIAGANTVGTGGTIEYVGRLQQDAASLDRFEMLHWPIDEALEAHLTNNDYWLARVRHVRAQVIAKGFKGVMITPRAAIKGAARIRAGIDIELADKLFLKRGMSDAQWEMVKPS